MKAARDSIDAVLEEIIEDHERNTSPEKNGCFLDELMSSILNQPINPGAEIPYVMARTNIKAILLDLIAASYDSSTAAIEWTLSELIRNPCVLSRLQGELESIVGTDRMVEETDLPNLSYLEMVVKESLRLYPVAPLLLPRESMEDIEIMGYFIPKKSRIVINAWALGRDENVWSDNVEEFFPERFISSDVDVKGHDFGLIPFGSGRRTCPGMHIGLKITRLVVAQLVH